MPRQIGFHFYSVQVRAPYQALETLSKIPSNKPNQPQVDALNLFGDGLKALQGQHRIDEAANRMSCLIRTDVTERHITGLIDAGHYGEAARIVNSRTKQTAHRQTLDESSMLPCFFRLVVLKNENRALLTLQRDNRVPAKQALADILTQLIRRHNSDLSCALLPIANKATFERLVGSGEVQEVRYIRLMKPQDIFDKYGQQGRTEKPGTAELIHRAARGTSLPAKNSLLRLIRGEKASDVFEFPEFPFERIKAKIRIGGKLQTVDFGRGMTQPIIDVTERVKFDVTTGHPTYDSLAAVTLDLAEDHDLTS